MRVKSITYAGKANVYNMEVADTHDFAVNGGVIVHNCYDMIRYVAMANPIAPRADKIKPLLLENDPLDMNKDILRKYGKTNFYNL